MTLSHFVRLIAQQQQLADTIRHFSTNPHRRVDLIAQLHNHADRASAI